MNPVHTFQPTCSRFILILSSHLYISLSSVLSYSGPPTGILYWYLYAFHECYNFHTSHHDICSEEYKLLICYAVCLPSCHFQSCLSVLHYTTHFTSLICRHFSQFMYFVCKRVYTSFEALTVVLLGNCVFQDVTHCCLDLLLDKYLHCGEHAAQIMQT